MLSRRFMLRKMLRRCLAMDIRRRKGSEKGFSDGALIEGASKAHGES